MTSLEKEVRLQEVDRKFQKRLDKILTEQELMAGYTKDGGRESTIRKIETATAEHQVARIAIINEYMRTNLF